jgi:predicted nucleic acid-binding protein
VYLHCAVQGRAGWLITRDQDLLDRAGDDDLGSLRVVPPEVFLAQALESGLPIAD